MKNINVPGLSPMVDYVTGHWRGEQPLLWAFWVNLIGIRLVLFALQSALMPEAGQDYSNLTLPVTAGTVFFHGVILLWQIVGVVRAADRHFAEHGNMALVWGAQLGAVLLFLLSAVYSLEAMQTTMVAPVDENLLARLDREHASQYRLDVSVTGRQLHIDGQIELGITRAVRQLLSDHPSIDTVILSSRGGNIYEGRGLAILVRERQLNTRVDSICASACTTAFVGGVVRSIKPEARLGFHQYRVDADYTIIVTDVAKEQARDSALFLEAGVEESFVRSMFDRVSDDMWWPTLEELRDAGVVHEVSF